MVKRFFTALGVALPPGVDAVYLSSRGRVQGI